MIWKIWKKSKLNSKKIWKMRKKSKLNSEKIWKFWKKSKLNSEKIWKMRQKSKLNSEKIWKIWKKSKLNSEKIWKMGKCTTTIVREKRGESDVTSGHVSDVTSGHLPSNDVISGDATSGYILKTNNRFCLFWEPLYCNAFYVI